MAKEVNSAMPLGTRYHVSGTGRGRKATPLARDLRIGDGKAVMREQQSTSDPKEKKMFSCICDFGVVGLPHNPDRCLPTRRKS
eukprot:1066009-Rhodomonas_salina.1